MKKHLAALAVCLSAVGLYACGDSWDTGATPTQSDALAKTQVERLFNDVQSRNTADLGDFLAPDFQLLRTDGTSADKQQYIDQLPTLKSYSIGAVTGLEYSNTLTATYSAATNLVVDGKQYNGAPNPFLSVFVKRGGQWRLVGHGNFNTPAN